MKKYMPFLFAALIAANISTIDSVKAYIENNHFLYDYEEFLNNHFLWVPIQKM